MIIKAQGINKKYPRSTKSTSHFEAVKPLDIQIEEGKLTEITGRSGSGKSTLLYILAGLLKPTSGKVFLDDLDLYSLNDKKLSELRNKKMGIIPQGQTGLYSLTVLQNVLVPAMIYGDTKDYEKKALELLEMTGIQDLKDVRMTELSGGEMRRMSIARALLLEPEIIFADEPTDDLDDENTRNVLELLKDITKGGKSVFIVTHEPTAVKYADIVYKMDAGNLFLES